MRDIRSTLIASTVCCALAGESLAAQQRNAVVTVRVRSASDVIIPGAEVSITRGLSAPLASGATNASGVVRLTLPRSAEDLEIVARKIGYRRRSQFFRADRDSMAITVRLDAA